MGANAYHLCRRDIDNDRMFTAPPPECPAGFAPASIMVPAANQIRAYSVMQGAESGATFDAPNRVTNFEMRRR